MGIANMLAAANAESVAYRYREDVTPHEVDAGALKIAFHKTLSAMEVVKLADCLDYQSCECPSWANGYAKVILDAIKEQALGDAGYPGWDGEAYRGLSEYSAAEWSI